MGKHPFYDKNTWMQMKKHCQSLGLLCTLLTWHFNEGQKLPTSMVPVHNRSGTGDQVTVLMSLWPLRVNFSQCVSYFLFV